MRPAPVAPPAAPDLPAPPPLFASWEDYLTRTTVPRGTHVVWIWLACDVVSALVVQPLRRFTPVRSAVTGWQTGAALVAAISAMTLVLNGLQ